MTSSWTPERAIRLYQLLFHYGSHVHIILIGHNAIYQIGWCWWWSVSNGGASYSRSIASSITIIFRGENVGASRAPFQYLVRRLVVRSREASKPPDLYLDWADRSEILTASRQHCCRGACQISKRCNNLSRQSRRFEASRDLMIRRLTEYWNDVQAFFTSRDQWDRTALSFGRA